METVITTQPTLLVAGESPLEEEEEKQKETITPYDVTWMPVAPIVTPASTGDCSCGGCFCCFGIPDCQCCDCGSNPATADNNADSGDHGCGDCNCDCDCGDGSCDCCDGSCDCGDGSCDCGDGSCDCGDGSCDCGGCDCNGCTIL